MNSWLVAPLAFAPLAIASMSVSFDKYGQNPAIAEARIAHGAVNRGGPRKGSFPSGAGARGDQDLAESNLRDRYERLFMTQVVDRAWAEAAQASAGACLTSFLPAGSLLRSIECRASMCRVETSHPDVTTSTQFVRSALLGTYGRAWKGASYSAPLDSLGASNEVVLVTYLAREGNGLSAFD